MSYGIIIALVHILIAAPLLGYAGWCLKTGKKCVTGFAETLIALAVGVLIYHLYKLLIRFKIIKLEGYENKNVNESFVPFSFPYHNESTRYYSYHDDQHTRNCNCQHNDGHTGCHATCSCGNTPCVCGCKESFDTVSPVSESSVYSGLI